MSYLVIHGEGLFIVDEIVLIIELVAFVTHLHEVHILGAGFFYQYQPQLGLNYPNPMCSLEVVYDLMVK
ncbi:MAG TPA: hypothetical protein PLW93_05395 [Candidatus Absconditabacterales bacterium]|nr:hypothetical protein [Candidatus Absconditabacterales bacterium]HNG97679.1 hypothetical protein [Candidatus Absconditabacterales bacterium]